MMYLSTITGYSVDNYFTDLAEYPLLDFVNVNGGHINKKYLVVIPSIRQVDYAKFHGLGSAFTFLLVDDTDGVLKRPKPPPDWIIWYREDTEKLLGEKAHIIPRKSPSCKNIGTYLAYKNHFDGVCYLDDDVTIRNHSLFHEEVPIGKYTSAIRASGEVINPLGYSMPSMELKSRGFPHSLLSSQEKIVQRNDTDIVYSVFNMGLWTGLPDISAIDKLWMRYSSKPYEVGLYDLNFKRYYIPYGAWMPISIMNVQLLTELAPAFYQPPNYKFGYGEIRRHDDVWSGLFLSAIIEVLEYGNMTFGRPIVDHVSEDHPEKEILGEYYADTVMPYLNRTIKTAKKILLDTYDKSKYEMGYNIVNVTDLMCTVALHYIKQSRFPNSIRTVLTQYFSEALQWARLFLENQQ